MAQEGTFDTRIKALQEKLDDIKSCLAGNTSSKQWQKLSTQAKDLESTISSLIYKKENAIPLETRNQQRTSGRVIS